MRIFQFQIEYQAPEGFDHIQFSSRFANDIADLYKVEKFSVEPYSGVMAHTTHSAIVQLECTAIDHRQLFGQVHITADTVGIKIQGIPSGQMTFLDEL